MIGCDLWNINKETFDILSNKELLKINQDADCRQVIKLNRVWDIDGFKIYARFLENGDIALGFFNLTDKEEDALLNIDQLGLPESTGKTLEMHEVWTGETVTVKNGTFKPDSKIEPLGCRVYRCKVVDA